MKRPDHKFYDAKAIETVEQLDYDFSKTEKDMAMSAGAIARTILPGQIPTIRNLSCKLVLLEK